METKEETIIEVGAKVMRQLKVKSGELRNLRKAVRVGTVNVISIWMKMRQALCNEFFVFDDARCQMALHSQPLSVRRVQFRCPSKCSDCHIP